MAAVGNMATADAMVGVGGALDAGLGVSTIHILQFYSVKRQQQQWSLSIPYLCACVATIFATVCANEDIGFTWKTGYESLPSFNPLSVKITVRKWKHEAFSRGIELDLVRY